MSTKTTNPLQLVCFDLDGVLVDACEWHRVALNEALIEHGYPEISLADHFDLFNGKPTIVKLKILGITDPEIVKLISDTKQKKTITTIENLTNVDHEKIKIMNYLRDRGISIACVTNSIETTAQLMLTKAGISHYIDTLVHNTSVANPKPCSEGYIYAMVAHASLPSNTLIFEDSPLGEQAARNTGAKVYIVKNAADLTFDNFMRALHVNHFA